jgi:hypothetical protein
MRVTATLQRFTAKAGGKEGAKAPSLFSMDVKQGKFLYSQIVGLSATWE